MTDAQAHAQLDPVLYGDGDDIPNGLMAETFGPSPLRAAYGAVRFGIEMERLASCIWYPPEFWEDAAR